MKTILFLHSVLSEQNVPFFNELALQLEEHGFRIVLVGWDPVAKHLDLYPEKLQIPNRLNHFKNVYDKAKIKNDFKRYGLDIEFLVNRFNWWFPEPKNESEKEIRISFLHFHLFYFLQLLEKYKPYKVLIWNGNDPRQYILKTLAETFNIPRLFIERGPLPSIVFYDSKGVLSDSTVATLPKEQYHNKFNNYSSFKNYLDWYQNSKETLWEQPKVLENESLRDKLKIRIDQKVTLFVGQVDNDVQTQQFSPYFSSNLDAFKWFVDKGRSDGYFVLGKHHPKSKVPISAYKAIIESNDGILWTDDIPLNDCLELADNVVAVNSSVIFDALLYKKPVLSLGNTMLHGKSILYEYDPNTEHKILEEFYLSKDLLAKTNNYRSILEYMLSENLIFLKNDTDITKFVKILIESKQDKKFEIIDDGYEKIVQQYQKNILPNVKRASPKQKIINILSKIKRRIIANFNL